MMLKALIGFLVAAAVFPAPATAQTFDRPRSEACDKNFKDCDAAARLSQAMIRARGWRCDTISSLQWFAFSRGFYVRCNNFRYTYEIKDRGGNWVVTLD